MRTPEAIEKAKLKVYLDLIECHHFWPVQMGIGSPALDCIACISGFFVGIEVKAPGGRYTARQKKIMRDIVAAGGGVFSGTAQEIIKGISTWRSSFPGSASSSGNTSETQRAHRR